MQAPKPPDPFKTAAAQEGAERTASQTSSIANNPNQVTPWGSSNYSVSGYETVTGSNGKPVQVPRYTQTVKLSPEQQQLLDYQNQMGANLGQTGVEQSAKLRELLNKSIDTSSWQGWASAPQAQDIRQDTSATDRPAIEKAMMARWQEQQAKSSSAEDAALAARGMSPGSQQWGSVADTRARAQTDAVNQAYLASGQEARAAQEAYNQAAQQRYGMDFQNAQLNNQVRQGQAQETFALRNQPLNEISALMGGSQVTMPQFNPFNAQGVNSAPVGSYIQQGYQQKANQANAFNSGLFNLAGAGLGGWLAGL